jgi:hypothetical protein
MNRPEIVQRHDRCGHYKLFRFFFNHFNRDVGEDVGV